MTLEGVWEMFEGYSAETCAGKIPLLPMGGRAEGPACADTGARTPIGASGIFVSLLLSFFLSGVLFYMKLCLAPKVTKMKESTQKNSNLRTAPIMSMCFKSEELYVL